MWEWEKSPTSHVKGDCMKPGEKLTLFWVSVVIGIACVSIGIAQYSLGAGWIVGGVLSFAVIPVGLVYNYKFVKDNDEGE
jgi:hypothetical protein